MCGEKHAATVTSQLWLVSNYLCNQRGNKLVAAMLARISFTLKDTELSLW